MGVFRRKTSKGETEEYHYKFFSAGGYFYGVCDGCRSKTAAEAFEKKVKDAVKLGRKAGKDKRQFERIYEKTLNIEKEKIALEDAFAKYTEKPRSRKTGGKFLGQKESYWRDFQAFMAGMHKDVKFIHEVRRSQAEDYVGYIQKKGRYDQKIPTGGKGKPYTRKTGYLLSSRTVNLIVKTLREVFKSLASEAGLDENPFDIQMMRSEKQSREAFTVDELNLIFEKADDFIRPIFSIGICTALREGDICLLRKDELDLKENLIRKRTRKTGAVVEIPIITASFRDYLLELESKSGSSEYLLPDHAKMYQENPSGVSYRVRNFLENSVGIKTTREIRGRSRKVSVKDVHSLRHTFCYLAGLQNIPLLIVKAVAGHMNEEMTALYQRHSDLKAKRSELAKMPDFLGPSRGKTQKTGASKKQLISKIMRLLRTASSAQLQSALSILKATQAPIGMIP